MPDYSIALSKSAEKQLDKLPDDIADTLFIAIQSLANNPYPSGCKKLKGRKAYRIRSGNYRIIYEVFDNELVVDVLTLGHRRDIYK